MMSCVVDAGVTSNGQGERWPGEGGAAPGENGVCGGWVDSAEDTGTFARLLAALEPPQHAIAICPRCDGTRLGRWGVTRRGLQRWRCRGCRRTCTTATDTALAHLHSLAKLREVAIDMLAEAPRSCRALAAALGLDRMTIWRWRRLIAAAWARLGMPGAALAPGTIILRESRKASREWARHRQDPHRHPAPDRLRWIDYRLQRLPLPEPMSRWRVEVTLPSGTNGAGSPIPAGHVSGGSCDMPLATGPTAERFRDFLVPFTGPASRHLQTYVAWFEARAANIA